MPPLLHGEQLLDQLRKQREKGFLCDCTVTIGQSQFRAHRNVLAAFSEYFGSHCGTPVAEGVTASLDPELVNEGVFEKLLNYVYTGDLNIDSDNVTEICRAATFLKMEEVLTLCSLLLGEADTACSEVRVASDGEGVEIALNPPSPGVSSPLEPEGTEHRISETAEAETPVLPEQAPQTRAKRGRKPRPKPESVAVPLRGTRRQRARVAQSPSSEAFTDASNKATDVPAVQTEEDPAVACNAGDIKDLPERRRSPRKPPAKRGRGRRRRSARKRSRLKENCTRAASADEDGEEEEEEEDEEEQEEQRQAKMKPVCSTCGKTFSESSSLRRHMRIHKGVKPYECQLCGRAFRQGNQLKTHVRTHTGEKPYQCTLCEKGFAQKCQLVFHCRMHHGEEKPYKCDVCGLQFATSSNFKIHTRKHSGEKPYECDRCGKCFAQASTLTYHMRRHTGEKPYVCDTCGKAFAVSSSLITHSRKHTGETPYLCLVCGKGFMSSGELNKHLRSHTGGKRVECEFCGNSYTDMKYLKKHMAKVHKVDLNQDPGPVSFPLNIPIDHQALIARAPPDLVEPPAAQSPDGAVTHTETQFIFIQTLN